MNQTRRWVLPLALATGALFAGLTATQAQQGAKVAKIGEPVRTFKLKDLWTGKEVAFPAVAAAAPAKSKPAKTKAEKDKAAKEKAKAPKATVAVFMNSSCSVSWRYEKRIGEAVAKYGKQGVQFVTLHSNKYTSDEDMKKWAQTRNLEFPLLADPKLEVAEYFNAMATPTFVVVDGQGRYRYFGSFDNNAEESEATEKYVPAALDAILAGKEVPVKQTRAFG
jgi:peroxiredoxin